jgi:hypothetical protein
MDELETLRIRKDMYSPVCSPNEIERIFNVKNGADYLLKLRADALVDSVRLFRVYLKKVREYPGEWSLQASFSDSHYYGVIYSLTDGDCRRLDGITFGDVFSREPAGNVLLTEYGLIIAVGEAVRYFLEYTHLQLLAAKADIPGHVRLNALRIGMRVLLGTEALDFILDPRGIIPPEVLKSILKPIPMQLQFLAGQAFAHVLLGHLSVASIVERRLWTSTDENDSNSEQVKRYAFTLAQEFEADIAAIARPQYTDEQRRDLLIGALIWLAGVDLFETVRHALACSPKDNGSPQPGTRERYNNLLASFSSLPGFSKEEFVKFTVALDQLKCVLSEDVALNRKPIYEVYGSLYLDMPDSQWRGPELIDRRDF